MRPRLSDIVTIASGLSGVSQKNIFSRRHDRPICAVRAAIYKIAHEAGYSYPQIGKAIGRDHSSVINGVQKIPSYRWFNPEIDALICSLRILARGLPPFVSEWGWQPQGSVKIAHRARPYNPAPLVAVPQLVPVPPAPEELDDIEMLSRAVARHYAHAA